MIPHMGQNSVGEAVWRRSGPRSLLGVEHQREAPCSEGWKPGLWITVSGRPVVELMPLPSKPTSVPWEQFRESLQGALADSRLTNQLAQLNPRYHGRSSASLTEGVPSRPQLGLAYTSLFIAMEPRRPLTDPPPQRIAISVISVAGLRLGVLAAADVPPELDASRR